MTQPLTPQEIDAFRARLTEVATRLFLRDGPDGLTLRALAAEAGVSRTTPYSYFKDKDDILDCIRAGGFDRLTERSRKELTPLSDPLSKMRALGWALVCFAQEEPSIYSLMFSRPVFSGELHPTLQAAVERYRRVSRPPLEEALRLGLVQGEPEALRRATWAAFHGLISLHLLGHIPSEEQLVQDFDLLNRIIGFGILTRPD